MIVAVVLFVSRMYSENCSSVCEIGQLKRVFIVDLFFFLQRDSAMAFATVSLVDRATSQVESVGVDDAVSLAHALRLALQCTNSYAIIDFLSGAPDASAIRSEILKLNSDHAFSKGELGGEGGEYWRTVDNTAKRNDLIQWVPVTAVREKMPAISAYRETIEILVRHLVDSQAHGFDFFRRLRGRSTKTIPELQNDRLMLALYPVTSEGSRFTVHCDNPPGDSGTGDNGRVLTFTYYANQNWDAPRHGGCLRIYDCGFSKAIPQQPHDRAHWVEAVESRGTSAAAGIVASTGHAWVEIEPLGNRLVVFFSDERVPHEVKEVRWSSDAPSYRASITAWYSFQDRAAELEGLKAAFAAWCSSKKQATS